MFHFSRCWSCFQPFNIVTDTVYSFIQGYSVCHRCAGRPCFDWGKRVCHELFLIPKTYYLVAKVVFIRVTPYVMHHLFANTTECNLDNMMLLNDYFFIMFLSICLADFLLHRVWIILHWNVDQHLGYSGLITLAEVSNHFKHMHATYLLTISLVSIQQVYMYFRGSGKAAEMKREAARGALRAAIWFISLLQKTLRIHYGPMLYI